MIELDNVYAPLCRIINKAYNHFFPNFPQFPKFSFSRAMIALWKAKVYSKLSKNLQSNFTFVLKEVRKEILAKLRGKAKESYNKLVKL